MISSQRKDGVFTFNMHANPLLSVIVDNEWRKDSFKKTAKNTANLEINESQDPFYKFPQEKTKEWNDLGLYELLGKFTDIKDIDKKENKTN